MPRKDFCGNSHDIYSALFTLNPFLWTVPVTSCVCPLFKTLHKELNCRVKQTCLQSGGFTGHTSVRGTQTWPGDIMRFLLHTELVFCEQTVVHCEAAGRVVSVSSHVLILSCRVLLAPPVSLGLLGREDHG